MTDFAFNPPRRSTVKDSQMDSYKNHVEDVPISWLKKLPGNGQRRTPQEQADLERQIQERGLESPLQISVGKNTRTAKLSEGNHRLRALEKLGHTHAPTRVEVGSEYGSEKKYGSSSNFDHDLIPKKGEYFRADARPSEVFKSLKK